MRGRQAWKEIGKMKTQAWYREVGNPYAARTLTYQREKDQANKLESTESTRVSDEALGAKEFEMGS